MNGEAIVIYGSVARGSSDPTSDLDVLVVSETPACSNYVELVTQSRFFRAPHAYIAFTNYNWVQFADMAASGSLFLQHLKSEGVCISGAGPSSRLNEILLDLAPYSRRDEDLAAFDLALREAQGYLMDARSVAFEASVAASTTRHASIVGSHLLGRIAFSYEASIATTFAGIGMESSVEPALNLYRWRRASARTGAPLSPYWTRERLSEFMSASLEMIRRLRQLEPST